MKSTNLVLSVSSLVLAIGAVTASGDAAAVTQPRVFAGNANMWCNGALPSFEGAIRKRPLAVQNEGGTNAFVTCTFASQNPANDGTPHTITQVKIWGASNDSAAHTLNCTGVSGYNTGTNEFIAKSVALSATNSQNVINWNAADFAGAPAVFPSGLFSISCLLEPGSGLNDMYVTFSEDVGL